MNRVLAVFAAASCAALAFAGNPTNQDLLFQQKSVYWSGGSVVEPVVGNSVGLNKFNAFGNHATSLQNGSVLMFDAGNYRVKVVQGVAGKTRYKQQVVAGNGNRLQNGVPFPGSNLNALDTSIGDVLGLTADMRQSANTTQSVYFTERGTGAIRRLFRRAGDSWGIDTIISPTTRTVRTAPAACEYALPGLATLPGTPQCNVGQHDFSSLDGGVTVARIVSTPTALLHDPWLNALWFFDGPVLRALQLRTVNGAPVASYVETKMTNSTGGSVFQDPVSINFGESPQHVLDFGIADGLGAVQDASDAYSFQQPTARDRTLVGGVVSPFQGYSMAWDDQRNLIFLDPLCNLVRRVSLDRTVADALGTAANISTVTVGRIDSLVGDAADCSLNTYSNVRRLQLHLDEKITANGRDNQGSRFRTVEQFGPTAVSDQYQLLLILNSGIEQLPGYSAPRPLLRVKNYLPSPFQSDSSKFTQIADGIGTNAWAGYAKYITKIDATLAGESPLTPARGSFTSGVSHTTFLLAGANTFNLTASLALGYDPEDPTALRSTRPNRIVGDPARSHVRLLSLAVDTADQSKFRAKLDTIYTSSTLRGSNNTTPLQVMGEDVRGTHVLGMAENSDGDILFVNVGATPITTDGAEAGFTALDCTAAHPECLPEQLADLVCHPACNNAECSFDGGDCSGTYGSYGYGTYYGTYTYGSTYGTYGTYGGGNGTNSNSTMRRELAQSLELGRIAHKYGLKLPEARDLEEGSEAEHLLADAPRKLQFSPKAQGAGGQFTTYGGTYGGTYGSPCKSLICEVDQEFAWAAAFAAANELASPFMGEAAEPAHTLGAEEFISLALAVSHPLVLLLERGALQEFFPVDAAQVAARVDRWRPVVRGDSWETFSEIDASFQLPRRSRFEMVAFRRELWIIGGNEEPADNPIAENFISASFGGPVFEPPSGSTYGGPTYTTDYFQQETTYETPLRSKREVPFTGNSTSNVMILNTTSGVWREGPSLNVPREDFMVVNVEDRMLLVVGGVQQQALRVNTSQFFTPGGMSTSTTPYRTASELFAAKDADKAEVDVIVEVNTSFVRTTEVYVPDESSAWIASDQLELPFGRDRAGAVYHAGLLYIVGGRKQCPVDVDANAGSPGNFTLLPGAAARIEAGALDADVPLPETPLEAYVKGLDPNRYIFNYGDLFDPENSKNVLGPAFFEGTDGTLSAGSFYGGGPGTYGGGPTYGGGGTGTYNTYSGTYGGTYSSTSCEADPFELCAPGCQPGWQCDSVCDPACNVEACGFDNEVCTSSTYGQGTECSPGCFPGWETDTICDCTCLTPECGFDNNVCTTAQVDSCESNGFQRRLGGSGKAVRQASVEAYRRLFQKEEDKFETWRDPQFWSSDDWAKTSTDQQGYTELFFENWQQDANVGKWRLYVGHSELEFESLLATSGGPTSSAAKRVQGRDAGTAETLTGLESFPCLEDSDRPYTSVDTLDPATGVWRQLKSRLRVPLVRPAVAASAGVIYATGGERLDVSHTHEVHVSNDDVSALQALYVTGEEDSEWRVMNFDASKLPAGGPFDTPFSSFKEVSSGLGGTSASPRLSMVAVGGRLFTPWETIQPPSRGDLSTVTDPVVWQPTTQAGFPGWGTKVHLASVDGAVYALSEQQFDSSQIRQAWFSTQLSRFVPLTDPVTVEDITPRVGSPGGGTQATLVFSLSPSVLLANPNLVAAEPDTADIEVTFNGAPAQLLAISQLERPQFSVTLLVPAGVGTGVEIRVQAARDDSVVGSANFFRYTPPTIATIAPVTGRARGGYALNITGAGFSLPARSAGQLTVTFERPDHNPFVADTSCRLITVPTSRIQHVNDALIRITQMPSGVGYGWIPRVKLAGQDDTLWTAITTNSSRFQIDNGRKASDPFSTNVNERPPYVFDYLPPKVTRVEFPFSEGLKPPTVGGAVLRIFAEGLKPFVATDTTYSSCGYTPAKSDQFAPAKVPGVRAVLADVDMEPDKVVLKHPSFKPQGCEGGPTYRVLGDVKGQGLVAADSPTAFQLNTPYVTMIECSLPPGVGSNWTVNVLVDGQRGQNWDVDRTPAPTPARSFDYASPEVYVVIPSRSGDISGGNVLTVRGVGFGRSQYEAGSASDPFIRVGAAAPWERPVRGNDDAIRITVGRHEDWKTQWVSDSTLRAVSPAGVGTEQVVKVCVLGQCSQSFVDEDALNVFQYTQPTVSSITPDTIFAGDFVDPRTFTIRGNDLGLAQENITQVVLAGATCLGWTFVDATSVLCHGVNGSDPNLRVAAGLQSVEVRVGNQVSTLTDGGLVTVIASPALRSSTPSRGTAGATVTVTGSSLVRDVTASDAQLSAEITQVLIGTAVCTGTLTGGAYRVEVTATAQTVTCTIPVPPGGVQAANLPVTVVNRAGKSSTLPAAFSYAGSGNVPLPARGLEAVTLPRPAGDASRQVRFTWYQQIDQTNKPTSFQIVYDKDPAVMRSLLNAKSSTQRQRLLQATSTANVSRVTVLLTTLENDASQLPITRELLDGPNVQIGRPPALGPLGNNNASNPHIPLKIADYVRSPAAQATDALFVARYTATETILGNSPYFFGILTFNDAGDSGFDIENGEAYMQGPVFDFCQQDEYLATNEPAVQDAVCTPCPNGAFCGGQPAHRVVTRSGFWRTPWAPLLFAECDIEEACAGYTDGSNPAQFYVRPSRFGFSASAALVNEPADSIVVPNSLLSANGSADALTVVSLNASAALLGNVAAQGDETATCGPEYTGVLCSRCAHNHARTGEAGCGECRSPGANVAALFGGAVLSAVVVLGMTYMTLAAKGKPKKTHVAIVKVFMTHLQTVGIAAGFPLQWPGSVLSVMEGMSTATSVSDNLLSPDCVADRTSIIEDFDGSTFYLRAVVIIMLPFIFVAALGLFWLLHYMLACPVCWDDGGIDDAREYCGMARKAPKPDDESGTKAVASCETGPEDAQGPSNTATARPEGDSPLAPPAETREDAGAATSDAGSERSDEAEVAEEATQNSLAKEAHVSEEDTAGDDLATNERAVAPVVAEPPAETEEGAEAAKATPARSKIASFSLQVDDLLSFHKSTHLEFFIVSVIVFAFLVHPTLTRMTLAMFTCTSLPGTDNTYLVVDKAVQCNTSESAPWMYAMGVPFFIFYALGIPAMAYLALRRHKPTLDSDQTRATYGFLYSSFNLNRYWWEELIMLRKVGFSVMAVLLAPLGIVSQTLLATIVLTLFAIFHARSMPYNKPVLNRLEMYSLVVALFTLQGGLYLFACDVCADVTREVITVLIILINMVFVVAVIIALLQSVLDSEGGDKSQAKGAIVLVVAALGKVCLGAAGDSSSGDGDGGAGGGESSGGGAAADDGGAGSSTTGGGEGVSLGRASV